jgi:hypothetical protein
MSDIKPTTNSQLPDRLYGEHYPDSFIDMPQPILTSRYKPVDDNDKYLQKVGKQSDKPCVACVAPESNFSHICPNNPILTCNCTDPKYCAELGNDPDSQYRDPDPNNDGFSDNLDYTGIPIPAPKRESKKLGWPCVVVGAVCETWVTTTERILRTTAGEWDTEQHTDAGLNNDGPAATTKL